MIDLTLHQSYDYPKWHISQMVRHDCTLHMLCSTPLFVTRKWWGEWYKCDHFLPGYFAFRHLQEVSVSRA